MSDDVKVTVTYFPSKAAHARALLLSYLVSHGAFHESVDMWPWPVPICPLCTYEARDGIAVEAPCKASE